MELVQKPVFRPIEQNRRVETKNKFMELQPSAAAEKTIYTYAERLN